MKQHWKEPPSHKELVVDFKLIDSDNSGNITVQELCKFLCSFGEPLTEAEVKQVVSKYDVNNDGKLNYAEFINTLMRA